MKHLWAKSWVSSIKDTVRPMRSDIIILVWFIKSVFFAKRVSSLRGLLNVSIYIHRNPIDTTIPKVTHLELYPYSSFPYYWNKTKQAPAFLDLETLNKLLSRTYEQSNASYCEYCLAYKQESDEDTQSEIREAPIIYKK